MPIRVLHDFGGAVTGYRRISPGEYGDGDARLFGATSELLTGGHAVLVVGPAPLKAFTPEPQTEEQLEPEPVEVVEDTEPAAELEPAPEPEELPNLPVRGKGGRVLGNKRGGK